MSPTPIPITILTGFLGSGKTTIILSLLPQLHALNATYKLALLKNEFGSLAVDSQLATSSSISSVRELLNGCICCNLVGSLSSALEELTTPPTQVEVQNETEARLENGQSSFKPPDRIVIETSGSAFPATLAIEINRLARETGGKYLLDGVVSVIDVENWKGYEDTSYTARIQARYMDLVVFNKWESVGERGFEDALDRLGDLEVHVPWVKSRKGWVDVGVVFGVDGGLARALSEGNEDGHGHDHDHRNGDVHKHVHKVGESHQSEVEVLSITLHGSPSATINTESLLQLLKSAPKDEVYRIKAILAASSPIPSSEDSPTSSNGQNHSGRYILNWAFGRWTSTPLKSTIEEHESSKGVVLRMTMILARYESTKWKKRLEKTGLLKLQGEEEGVLLVEKVT